MTEPKKKGRLRSLAINLGLVAGALGVSLLLAEVAIRIVAPQQLILIRPDLWQPADTVGWLHRPNVLTTINMGERTVQVATDDRGFRVSPSGPPAGDVDVLLLGDSFMEALQVEYEDSGAALLETALGADLGVDIAVRNAGIGGWDPDQYALHARSRLASGEYDLVITALYLGNDVISNRRDYLPPRAPVERNRFRLPRGLAPSEFVDAFLRPVNDLLEVRSHLYLFVRNRLQSVRMEMGLAPVPFPEPFLRSEAGTGRWDVTADLCVEIADLARQHDAQALFVMIPAAFQVDSASFTQAVRGFDLDPASVDADQPNRLLGRALKDRGLMVYDLLPEFRAAGARGARLYGTVDPHFSPEGNRLFATLVSPVAAELLSSQLAGTPQAPAAP